MICGRMLPSGQKECQDGLIYAGFTLTQFRHSYIQIAQWRPVRLVNLYLNWWTTEESFASQRVVVIRPPD
jgi:hypothetical protein